jgi:WS/DGAT/MGAT family acyltransferase
VPDPIRYEQRMSDSEALAWRMELDPLLRASLTLVWTLDRTPDRPRLEDKIERATRILPRLRQRVVSNALSIAPPRWELDPDFDLDFHARWLNAPGDGSLRAALEMVQPIAVRDFDRARPPWELLVLEGMQQGSAALILKLHHLISDGVGLARLTKRLVERERSPARDPGALPDAPEVEPPSQAEEIRDALGHEWRRQLGRARRSARLATRALPRAASDPAGAAREILEALGSARRLLQAPSEPLSPIMTGRSLGVRFDAVRLPLPALEAAAGRVGATLNDAFVAAVLGGLRRYHDEHGAPADRVRMTLPIDPRSGEKGRTAANQLAPARFEVPIATLDPLARMRAIGEIVAQQRREPVLALIEDVAGVLNRLPIAVSTALFGSLLKGIDLVTSHIAGPPFDVFTGGAHVDQMFAFGPLSGAAVHVTLFSYCGSLHLGVSTDPAAVPDPDLFVECLDKGFSEILGAA